MAVTWLPVRRLVTTVTTSPEDKDVEQHLKSVFTVLIVRHDPPRTGDTPQLGENSNLLTG